MRNAELWGDRFADQWKNQIGSIFYGDDALDAGEPQETAVLFPAEIDEAATQYDISFSSRAAVPGVYVPSQYVFDYEDQRVFIAEAERRQR